MNKVFEYDHYRAYLTDWIGSQPNGGRGQRAALAKALQSPISHISQVLKGISNLTLEQSEEVNHYLGHNAMESEYFLLLVQMARAGTPKLRQRLNQQFEQIRQKSLNLK